jgi:pyruvate/2-oxoglutarate dehydrogenase complex dihydrolipoamide acyltransferase (E2) component
MQTVALSLVFDHDTVDGAPAARFSRRFVGLVERGAFLED